MNTGLPGEYSFKRNDQSQIACSNLHEMDINQALFSLHQYFLLKLSKEGISVHGASYIRASACLGFS